MKKLLLITCLLLLVSIFYFPGNSYAFMTDDYYPTAQGSSWVYKDKYSNSEGQNLEYLDSDSINGFEDVNYGGSVYTGFKFYNPDGSFLHCNIKRNTSSGFEQIKSFWSEGTNIGYSLYGSLTSSSPTGPYLWIPSSFNIGDVYEVRYKKYSYNSSDVLQRVSTEKDTMILEGLEDITVPAGTFEDCLKLKITAEENATNFDLDREGYAYVAKGIGVVKSDTDITWVGMDNISRWEKYSSELVSSSPVPEPCTMILFGLGGAGMAFLRRRKATKEGVR